jgi:dihydrofolate reductase
MLETLHATRYVTPLREGGSLPALVEANDDGLYVLKFRGAGQGRKALIAELIAGEIGRALGLPVPRLAFMQLNPALGRNEPDYEIRTLLESSAGLNFAMDFLPGSITFDPMANVIDAGLASEIVWFDAFIMNVDRTARNTNMLIWHKKLYLIDHGASLFFHHQWESAVNKYESPFVAIKDHVLLRFASEAMNAGQKFKQILDQDLLRSIIALIPDEWLEGDPFFKNVIDHREAYLNFLMKRLESSNTFEQEAIRAGANII